MNVPIRTATSPSHGIDVGGEGSVGARSPERGAGGDAFIFAPIPRVDARFNRHARNQSIGESVRIVDEDLYRDALHNFGEVASRIIRRSRAILHPRPARMPVHARVTYVRETYPR